MIKPIINTTISGGLVQVDEYIIEAEVYSGSRFDDEIWSLANIIYIHDGYWPLSVWSPVGLQKPQCLPLNWSLL